MTREVLDALEQAAELTRRHVGHPERAAALALRLHRVTAPTELVYTRFPPTLSLVLAGRKRSVVGDSDERWGAGRFLITPVDLPVVAAVVETGDRGDFLSANWHLDPLVVAEIAALAPRTAPRAPAPRIGTVTEEMADSLRRLFRLLDAPADIPVLAPAITRELVLRCAPPRAARPDPLSGGRCRGDSERRVPRRQTRAPTMPPSTSSVVPWTYEASSETSQRTARAISSGRPGRPAGADAVICSRIAAACSLPGVRVAPGATATTRTPLGPYSAAHARVRCSSAALVAG
ncbi:hypothetical protein C5C36_09875 [Rathayibacter sp. AY1G1]|nr:hypothetical protein C5C36_09875 [Rathayibacter sp. AY1G1]